MVIDLGKGTLMAESEVEALWYHQHQEGLAYIKQIKGSIANSERELKLSAREVHKKFIAGTRLNIKQKKNALIVQKEFVKFMSTKIDIKTCGTPPTPPI